jgi:tetratricopeptide (TPR) repeat protein
MHHSKKSTSHGRSFLMLICIFLILIGCGPSVPHLEETLAEAENLRAEGDLAGALQQLEALREHYPEDQTLLETLAFLQVEAGNHTMAAALFTELSEGPGSMSEYRLMAAQSLLEAEDTEGAIEAYREYLQNHPEDAATHSALAELLHSRNQPLEAIVPALESYRLQPSSAVAIQLGDLYLAVENIAQARQWYRIAEERGEDLEAEALLGQLQCSLKLRRFTESRTLIQRLDDEFPGRLDVSPVAFARTQLDEWEKRRAELQRETERISTEPAVETATETLAPQPAERAEAVPSEDASESSGNTEPPPQSAETVPETTAEATPASVAEDQTESDGVEDKMSVVENTVPMTEDSADPSREPPAGVPENPEQTVETNASGERAGSEPPSSAPPSGPVEWLAQAEEAAENGQHTQARDLLRKVLQVRPEEAEVWSTLSDAHFALEEYDWAETTALEAVRRDRDNVLYTLQFLRAAQRTMKPPQFLNELRKARIRFPNYPDITLAVARGYKNIARNYRNAAALYEEFLRQAPDHPQAEQARQELLMVKPGR